MLKSTFEGSSFREGCLCGRLSVGVALRGLPLGAQFEVFVKGELPFQSVVQRGATLEELPLMGVPFGEVTFQWCLSSEGCP